MHHQLSQEFLAFAKCFDRFTKMLHKQPGSIGLELLAHQRMSFSNLLLDKVDRRADCGKFDSVLGAENAKHVRFGQIVK
jgi:hypothetical protein